MQARARAVALKLASLHGEAGDRVVHGKMHYGFTDGKFVVNPKLHPSLHTSLFQPGREFKARGRGSHNSRNQRARDGLGPQGIAIELATRDDVQTLTGEVGVHHIPSNTYQRNHVKTSVEFAALQAAARHLSRKELKPAIAELRTFGLFGLLRVSVLLVPQLLRSPKGLSTETYFSRMPFYWGERVVNWRWRPVDQLSLLDRVREWIPLVGHGFKGQRFRAGFEARRARGAVEFVLEVEDAAAIDDMSRVGRRNWREVGRLTIPQADLAEQLRQFDAMKDVRFNPGTVRSEHAPAIASGIDRVLGYRAVQQGLASIGL
jgi:hypothetical protein